MKKQEEKKRLSLADFYFSDKHEAGTRMPIMLPSGIDSGEWLQVIGPDCDKAILAGRAYTMAVRALDEQLTEELSGLESKCKERNDYTAWNKAWEDRRGWAVEPLNKELAAELVTGWSFDSNGTPEPFSKEAFVTLMAKCRGLAEQVSAHHVKSREELNAK